MSFSILVATPTVAFGDLIGNSLKESGRYTVQVVHTALEALESAKSGAFGIVVLDSDLEDNGMRCLAEDITANQPGVKLILIPPDNDPRHPIMDGLKCNAYLRKPFYLPDLIELMDELVADGFEEPAAVESGTNWLEDADLEGLIAATGARAALVSRADGASVFGGGLPEGAHGELLELAGRFWQRPERTDLVRFVRLKGDEQDTLLYLTAVMEEGEIGLVLLYPVTTPLSKVRSQAGLFVRGLREMAANPDFKIETIVPLPVAVPKPRPALNGQDSFLEYLGGEDEREEAVLRDFNMAELLGSIPSPDPNGNSALEGADLPGGGWMPETMMTFPEVTSAQNGVEGARSEPALEDETGAGIKPSSEDTPGPGMGYEETGLDADAVVTDEPSLRWEPEAEDAAPEDGSPELVRLDLDRLVSGEIEADSVFNQPLPRFEDDERAGFPGSGSPEDDPFDWAAAIRPYTNLETGPEPEKSSAQEQAAREARQLLDGIWPENPAAPSPSPADMDIPEGGSPEEQPDLEPAPAVEGMPDQGSLAASPQINEPGEIPPTTEMGPPEETAPGTDLMVYTCILVPRIPQHFLTGELSEKVSQWVQNISQELEWRLKGIALRPEYMQWTVEVSLSTSPGSLVKIARERTSSLIFGQFEQLREQNPSGDFWADGYLIVNGPRPPSASLLRDYIQQTRRAKAGAADEPTPSLAS